MRKMSKMKKGLVGLTAAAMLAGSCVAGPAFAVDDTINNEGSTAKEVTFTVNVGDKWTVTVPTEVTATFANDKISITAEQLKAKFEALPRFANGKKLALYLHDKADSGSAINSLTFKEQDENGDKAAGATYELKLLKDSADLTNGKILEITPGENIAENLEKGLSGETTENVYKSGTYKAKAAFVVTLEDAT